MHSSSQDRNELMRHILTFIHITSRDFDLHYYTDMMCMKKQQILMSEFTPLS